MNLEVVVVGMVESYVCVGARLSLLGCRPAQEKHGQEGLGRGRGAVHRPDS